MMMSIRSLVLVPLIPLCFTAACAEEGAEDPTVEAYSAALSASEPEGDGLALGALAFPRRPGAVIAAGLTIEQRVANLKAFIDERLDCADAVEAEDGLEIVFTKDCTWMGRRWTGTVDITWVAGGDTAELDFEGVAVNGATLTGTMSVTRIEEGHVTVEADWTRTNARHSVTGAYDGDYTWDDTTFTVNSATHALTIDGHTATRTSTALVWQRDQVAPQSGTVSFTGFRGKSWTMTFSRDEAGKVVITVTGPEGQVRVFTPGDRGADDDAV